MGIDPFEGLDELEEFRQQEGHPWHIAMPWNGMLADLHVTVQSTKILIDRTGIISYRDGYGVGDVIEWRKAMENITY